MFRGLFIFHLILTFIQISKLFFPGIPITLTSRKIKELDEIIYRRNYFKFLSKLTNKFFVR